MGTTVEIYLYAAGSVRACGVVLTGSVVMISLRIGIEWCQPIQPQLVVFVQPMFVVVDEHARGDVHGVH
jgi:hypothetical protein